MPMAALLMFRPGIVLVEKAQSFNIGVASVFPYKRTAAAAAFNSQLSYINRPERLTDHDVSGDWAPGASAGYVAFSGGPQRHLPQAIDPGSVGELMN